MRIAMFTNNYKPYIGGVPVSIEHLAGQLRKQGHTVYVFAPTYKEQVEEDYVIRYPSFPIQVAKAPIPNILTKVFEEKVLELEIDVIHVHHPALVGNVALALKKKYGIPVVFTYHTRYEEYLHYIHGLEKVEEATGMVERYLKYFCNRCDLIAAPTPGIKKYLLEKGIDTPIGILPTGLPETNFCPSEAAAEKLRKNYIKDADYLFCTVSRLAKEKNIEFQLEGLAELKNRLAKRGKTFRHLIIGEGPERAQLLKRVKELELTEEITFLGNVKNEEIPMIQRASDAFLFSSKSETQGIVILEAMAAGNPVVAVKASGVKDVVEDGINGFLTEESVEKWVEKILYLIEMPELKRSMETAAVKTAEKYSEEQVAYRAADYYFTLYRNREAKPETVLFREHSMVR